MQCKLYSVVRETKQQRNLDAENVKLLLLLVFAACVLGLPTIPLLLVGTPTQSCTQEDNKARAEPEVQTVHLHTQV